MKQAYLGGGCFWCIEAVFEGMPGVDEVESGYAGGGDPAPTYDAVCSGTTGHAEVVRVAFDPGRVSYETILERFWKAHDPTTLNRQGGDVGTQYRSIILTTDAAQLAAAELSRAAAQREWDRPIVTELVALTKFYPAEAYHQDYFRRNPDAGYCRVVIRPKLQKFASPDGAAGGL